MIYTLRLVTGILSLRLSSTIAQQSCYWPDGTSVVQSRGAYVNCYPDRDSHCCSKGEVCLSNGLCYGPSFGWTYRGGCTVQDWSNTTACPNQYCNDLVPHMAAILWMCPHPPVSWWCGNYSKVIPCQTTTQVAQSFFSYTSGRMLGLPPIAITSSTQATVANIPPLTSIETSTFILTSTAASAEPVSAPSSTQVIGGILSPGTPVNTSTFNNTSAAAPASPPPSPTAATPAANTVPPEKPPQAANLEAAIGAGIGVPLGFVAMGLLGILLWRERRRNNRGDNRKVGQEKIISGDRTGAELDGRARSMEMPDCQIPWELDHRAVKVELDGA